MRSTPGTSGLADLDQRCPAPAEPNVVPLQCMAKSFATTAWKGYCTSRPGPRDQVDGGSVTAPVVEAVIEHERSAPQRHPARAIAGLKTVCPRRSYGVPALGIPFETPGDPSGYDEPRGRGFRAGTFGARCGALIARTPKGRNAARANEQLHPARPAFARSPRPSRLSSSWPHFRR